MTVPKSRAIDTAYELYNRDILSSSEYETIHAGLEEIEPLRDRDQELEDLWSQFGDIPMDPDTERMEEPFLDFPAGTPREDIWHWFDERHSKGIAYLLYGDGIDRTEDIARLYYLKQLCPECGSELCAFNSNGACKFPFIGGRAPCLNDDGCTDCICKDS